MAPATIPRIPFSDRSNRGQQQYPSVGGGSKKKSSNTNAVELVPIKKKSSTVIKPAAVKLQQQQQQQQTTATTATNKKSSFITAGSWSKMEHLAFLHGLRVYGPGKWKKLCQLIPTRDNVQIKSHGQLLLRKLKNGVDIFEDLDVYYQEQRHDQQKQAQPNYQSEQYRGGRGQHNLGTMNHPPPHNMMPYRPSYGQHPNSYQQGHNIRMPQQPQLRPPSDVIDAACGLVQLSTGPKVFRAFTQGRPLAATTSRDPKKSFLRRY